MRKKVNYSEELKTKAVKMYLEGKSSAEIAECLGIRNSGQIRIWAMWYRNGETHRFGQPIGKQYAYGKGIGELTELEQLKIRIRQLEMHNEILGKLNGILRK